MKCRINSKQYFAATLQSVGCQARCIALPANDDNEQQKSYTCNIFYERKKEKQEGANLLGLLRKIVISHAHIFFLNEKIYKSFILCVLCDEQRLFCILLYISYK